MSSGLYSGQPGLSLGTGLYRTVSSLWSGASGLTMAFGGAGMTLSLDFTTQTYSVNSNNYAFQSLITFTRTSSATYVDATGKIVSTPASRNLLTFTEQFDNVAWAKQWGSITSTNIAAPDGTNTAAVFTPTAQFANVRQVLSPTITSGSVTVSVWLRVASGTRNVFIRATASSLLYAKEVTVTSTWTRFSATFAYDGTNSINEFVVQDRATGGFVPIEIWGAQLEVGSTATSYTRNFGGLFPPRFDYDPVTLAPRGLLVEEQRTNVILTSSFQTLAGSAGSQYPSGTGWSNFFSTGGTRTYTNSSVFPGGQAVDIASVSAARNAIGFSFTPAASTTYTVSFYVESVSGVSGIVAFASGTLGTGGTSNNIVAPTSTGRYSYTFTTGTSPGTVDLRFGIGCSTNESGSIRISNVQCEAGSFATSYIPTVASQVTRTADVATITGANFSQWYNPAAGTLVAEFSGVPADNSNANQAARISDGTTNNRIQVSVVGGTSLRAGIVARAGSFEAALGAPPTVNTRYKIALAYAANDVALSVNGGAVETDASVVLPTVDQLQLVATTGHIRSIRYYPTRLSNAQLQALTA